MQFERFTASGITESCPESLLAKGANEQKREIGQLL